MSEEEANDGERESLWRRLRKKRWVRWSIDALIVVAIFIGVGMWQTRNLADRGEKAPDFELVDLDGQTRSLDDYRGSQTVVVLWAPWCAVCGQESSNVSRLHDWFGDRVDVVSIALDYESRGDVETFVENNDVDYPVLLGDHATREAFNVSSYPTKYVLSDDGRIERASVGYTTTFGLIWRALL
ncbi:MAG: peroxiredoxin family protein [Persicimonas sp.]